MKAYPITVTSGPYIYLDQVVVVTTGDNTRDHKVVTITTNYYQFIIHDMFGNEILVMAEVFFSWSALCY